MGELEGLNKNCYGTDFLQLGTLLTIFRGLSEAIDTLYDPYFHFRCELALEP